MSVIAYWLMGKLGITARLASFIAWAGSVLLALLALWGAYLWAYNNGRDDERAKWEAAAQMLEDADAAADAEAIDVAHDTKDEINAGNERAKQAAAGGDDPLAAGFDSLRKEGSRGSDKATR